MCPFGYDDVSVGLCIGCFIIFGLVGCIVMGIVADRTQKLEEVTKILYAFGVISLMTLGLVSRRVVVALVFSSSLLSVHRERSAILLALSDLCHRWLDECARLTAESRSEH